MPGRFLLDSNIVIALLQEDQGVISALREASRVFIPAVVLGELFFGAAKSARSAENTATVERFGATQVVLPCDLEVAREYGRIKNELRLKGRPIPENDLWFAAVAVVHGLILVTRDEHFSQVEGLETVAWVARS